MPITEADIKKQNDLERDLAAVLNKYSQENGSDTPDFILARYLLCCIDSYNFAIQEREKWYGRNSSGQVIVQ